MQSQKDQLIAKKYAEALAELREGETVIEDLEKVRQAFEESEELREFLANPAYNSDQKKEIIKTIFAKEVQKEVLSTILVLLERHRIGLATMLAENYKTIYYQRANIEFARVSSASKLETKELEEIKAQLEKTFNKKVELSNELDESLVAGIKINVANKVIDSSLRTKLKKLKSLLLN
ncbi:MAG: ATP synthase F1 subunit delta [Candidatus Melainabacteria bacterium]|nr:ATP synthase F1 subunit delta [Candidatus Melainabacteria bacterium]